MSVTDYAYALLEPAFYLFTLKETALVLSIGILITLVVSTAWFLGRTIRRPVRELRDATQALARMPDRAGFVGQFARIDQSMRRSKWLAHAWQEFDETVLKPEPQAAQVVRITARPGDYLNREMCGLTFPIWQALPNYFVGIGLLFTFFGLVAALYFASGAVAADIASAQDALGRLLSAATFKFMTSICGLFSSIVFSVVYHKGLRALDVAFERLGEQIERLTQVATTEAIADAQLAQLERQTAQLERFNTNIAMEIVDGLAGRLDASIAEGLRRAIEPLTVAVNRLGDGLGNQNLEALREMSEAFRRQLQAGAGDEFGRIAEALGQLREGLRGTSDRLVTQVEGFGGQIAGAADRLGAAADAMVGQLQQGFAAAGDDLTARLQGSGERLHDDLTHAGSGFAATLDEATRRLTSTLEPLNQRLDSFVTVLADLDVRVGQQAEAFGQVSAQAREAAQAVGEAAQRMRAAAEPVAGTAHRLEAATGRLDEVLAGLQQTRTSLDMLGERLAGVSATLDRSWQAYAARFDQVDERLEYVFTAFSEGTRAYHDTVREFVAELDRSFGKSLGMLNGAVQEIGDAANGLSDAVDRLGVVRQAAE